MAAEGHVGGHLSSSASKFIARYVAPLVKKSDWSPELIDNIILGLPDKISDAPTRTPAKQSLPSSTLEDDSDSDPAIRAVPIMQPERKPTTSDPVEPAG